MRMKPKALLFLVCLLTAFGLLATPAQAANISLVPQLAMHGELGLFAVFGLLALAGFAFWIWMLIDCANSKRLDSNDRLIWILIIIFLGLLGAILYFFIKKDK